MTDNLISPKKFFEFEEENQLFDLKHKKIFFWDIIRFDIYYTILWNLNNNQQFIDKKKSNKSLIFREFIFFALSFLFKKYEYLFFTTSRNKDENNLFFDQNLQDILMHYPNAVCFESYERNIDNLKNKKITIFNPINLFRVIGKIFYKNYDFFELTNLVNEKFKTSNICSADINTLITQFQIDFKFYSFIFRFKKPKAIFITQNGIQKGLFAAANKFNIPVIEVQHGIIDDGHLSYNYNKNINYEGGRVFLPSYFFTFSDFWKREIYYPVKDILTMGNSYFYNTINKIKPSNKQKGILVASSDVFGEQLKELVIDFSKKHKIPIYFKLHPNQFFQKGYYKEIFKEFDNVQVFTNEKSIYELIELSCAVLVIQSTALYEALHLKRIGVIFKRQTYTRHQHLFGDKNVYLIDDSDELHNVINNQFQENYQNEFLYFNDFDSMKFINFNQILNKVSN